MNIVAGSTNKTVTVGPDVLDTVNVTPSAIELQWRATQQFLAVGVDRFGNEIPDLAFSWDATGGEISQNGNFTAGTTAGSYTVTASALSGVQVEDSSLVGVPAPLNRFG